MREIEVPVQARGRRPEPDSRGEASPSPAETLSLRVLGHLATLIHTRPFLREFEIIPVDTNTSNKSPIVHTNQNLGLESWCVKHIYNYAYNRLMEEYFLKKCTKKMDRSNSETLDGLLMGVLLINPDISTFWNKRKEMVARDLLSYEHELKFSRIVLSHKSKCNEVFAYRKWLLKRYFIDLSLSTFIIRDLLNEELTLIDYCTEKSSNNYHAWSHRIWLIQQSRVVDAESLLYCSELMESDKWLTAHVSDYSGLHYRQFCVKNLLNSDNFYTGVGNINFKDTLHEFWTANMPDVELPLANKNYNEKRLINIMLGSVLDPDEDKYPRVYCSVGLLINEIKVNEDLCCLYSSHESLWCHRRFILQQLIMIIFEYFGEDRPRVNNHSSELNERHLKIGSTSNIISDLKETRSSLIVDRGSFGKEPKILRCDNHSIYSSCLYKAIVSNERKFIDDRSKAGDEFSKRYETWLKVILHLSF